MFALPIFTVRGNEVSAAGGGYSEPSEWQRSASDEGAYAPRTFAGYRNRILSFAVKKQSGGLF